MSKRLPLFLTDNALPTSQVEALPHTPISTDWYGTPIPFACEFVLALDSDVLHFHVRVANAPHYDATHAGGAFIEGLWTMDCAELFIKEPQSSRYQEFNLAPSGAWWSASFSEYRQRSLVATPESASGSAAATEANWSASLRIVRDKLLIAPSALESGSANVTFILRHPEEHFYSFASLGNGEPDFHRIDQFLGWQATRI